MTNLTTPMNKFSKLLIILALLFAIFVTVVGCVDTPDNRTTTVVAVEEQSGFGATSGRSDCMYTVKDGRGYHSGFLNDCGLFNVGDRVHYQKVQP